MSQSDSFFMDIVENEYEDTLNPWGGFWPGCGDEMDVRYLPAHLCPRPRFSFRVFSPSPFPSAFSFYYVFSNRILQVQDEGELRQNDLTPRGAREQIRSTNREGIAFFRCRIR